LNTKTVTSASNVVFVGDSDDRFLAYGEAEAWDLEIAFDSPERFGAYRVTAPDGSGLFVTASYGPGNLDVGVWALGVAPLDEGRPIPDWALRVGLAENGYSSKITLGLPAGATVSPVDTGQSGIL
jgi:hypothetical protein